MAKAHKRTALDQYIDPRTIDAYLDGDPDVVQGKVELATMARDYARSISPEESGDYKEGIVVRRSGRSGVSLEFTDEISNLVEYGSIHNPEFAVRARTAAEFGGTVDKS